MILYLAAPYSNVEYKPKLMRELAKFAGEYMIDNPGLYVVPGLVHHYSLESVPALGSDYVFWEEFCHKLIDRCDGTLVWQYPGWVESAGVIDEIEYTRSLRKPVFYAEYI